MKFLQNILTPVLNQDFNWYDGFKGIEGHKFCILRFDSLIKFFFLVHVKERLGKSQQNFPNPIE